MKVRIFYRDNKSIIYMVPIFKEKKAGQTDEDFMTEQSIKAKLDNVPFDDFDTKDLPDRSKMSKWRGEKGKGVWIDESIVLPAELRKAKADELDTELAKENPDPVKVIRLNRELEKMK